MNLLLRKHKVHRLVKIDPSNPVFFSTIEEQYKETTGEQAIHSAIDHGMDASGLKVDEGSIPVCDGKSGDIFQAQNTFRCNRCFHFFNLRRRAKKIPPEVNSGVPLCNEITGKVIVVPAGFCRRCWWLVEAWKSLGLALAHLVCDPIIAIHEQERPATRQPRVVPMIVKAPPAEAAAPDPGDPPPRPASPPPKKNGRGAVAPILILGFTAAAFLQSTGVAEDRSVMGNVTDEVVMSESGGEIGPKQVAQLLEQAVRLGLDDPTVDSTAHGLIIVLKIMLESGEVDELRFGMLKERVELRMEEVGEHVLAFEPPDPVKIYQPGDMVFLRTSIRNLPIGVSLPIASRGTNVFGDTGTGKSSLLRGMAEVWTALRLPCIVFASKPDQFLAKLASMPHNIGRSLFLRCHIDAVYNAFASVSGRATDFISSKLQKWQVCFNKWDSGSVVAHVLKLFEAEKSRIGMVAPTVDYFVGKIEEIRLRRDLFNSNLKASAYEAFSLMQESTLGRSTMKCQVGVDLKKVWESALLAIIDTSKLRDDEMHFLVSCMLSDLREIREAKPGLPPLLVVIDEAGSLIAQRWDSGNRLSPMASEVTLLRGSGIYLAIGFHTVSGINPPVRSNSAVTIILPLGNGSDAFPAGQAGGLSTAQCAAIPKLKPYTAIGKITGTDWAEPMVVTWDKPQDYPDFSEPGRLAMNSTVLAKLPKILPVSYRLPVAVVTTSPAAPAVAPPVSRTPSMVASSVSTPTGDYLAILRDISFSGRPFMNVTERVSGLSLPSKKVLSVHELKAVLTDLTKDGYCGFLTIQTKSRAGRGGEFYFLESLGHAAIGSLHKPARGGTDFGHDFCQRFLQHILEAKSTPSTIEARLASGSSPVDVGVMPCPHTGLNIACQIPLSTFATEPRQAVTNLREGWQRCLEICLTTTELKKLAMEFKKAGVSDCRIAGVVVADISNAGSLAEIVDNPKFFI